MKATLKTSSLEQQLQLTEITPALDVSATEESSPKIYTVTELVRDANLLLQRTYSKIWVEGEISGFKVYSSGHGYLTLKDAGASLSAIIFRTRLSRLRFQLTDGMQVLCAGSLGIYEARGTFQLTIERVEPKGLGALQVAFEQLKAKLAAEGLFEPSRKRPLPLFPERIGIVTSPKGAAIHDMLQILKRRFAGLHILINPVRVQGDGAAADIARAIREFNVMHERLPIDVLIVGRGGGSLEDLWAFNEEAVARAIAGSAIPVISAVGHEVDYTIADFVADVRAKTPSEAAEIVISTKQEFADRIADARETLHQLLRQQLDELRQRVEMLTSHHVFRQPQVIIEQFQQRVDELGRRAAQTTAHRLMLARETLAGLAGRLHALNPQQQLAQCRLRLRHVTDGMASGMRRQLQRCDAAIRTLAGRLEALSPVAILARGYSLTYDTAQDRLIKSIREIHVGARLRTRVADGTFISTVESIEQEPNA